MLCSSKDTSLYHCIHFCRRQKEHSGHHGPDDQARLLHSREHRLSQKVEQKFTKRSHVSKYETRRANDLQIPRPRLEITTKSFSYKGAKMWNDMPNNIRNVESAAFFKSRLENFLGQKHIEDLKHDLLEEQCD